MKCENTRGTHLENIYTLVWVRAFTLAYVCHVVHYIPAVWIPNCKYEQVFLRLLLLVRICVTRKQHIRLLSLFNAGFHLVPFQLGQSYDNMQIHLQKIHEELIVTDERKRVNLNFIFTKVLEFCF